MQLPFPAPFLALGIWPVTRLVAMIARIDGIPTLATLNLPPRHVGQLFVTPFTQASKRVNRSRGIFGPFRKQAPPSQQSTNPYRFLANTARPRHQGLKRHFGIFFGFVTHD